MQTYTHLLVGLALGLKLYPDNPLAEALTISGAIAPDMVLVIPFVIDKFKKKKPLEEQSKKLRLRIAIGHSLPLWYIALLLTWYSKGPIPVASFFLGVCSHIVIDICTHNGVQFRDTECGYLWPLPWKLGRLGFWEYRYDHGDLRPKPFEILIMCSLLVYSIYKIL